MKLENENSNKPLNPQLNIGAVSGSTVFSKELLDKITVEKPYYCIGVDNYDKKAFAYCLSRKVNENVEILLCKTTTNEDEFKKEVNNLSKYFDCDIIGSEDYIKPIDLAISDYLQNHIDLQKKSMEYLKKNPLMIPKGIFGK